RAQERIWASQRQAAPLHQGTEVRLALPPAKPSGPGAQEPEALARRQQAAQYRLPAQGVLRSALGLQPRGLGAQVLRELAGEPEVATPQALREVRRDDRSALGRHRRLLPAREQGRARLRRRTEQQDPCL